MPVDGQRRQCRCQPSGRISDRSRRYLGWCVVLTLNEEQLRRERGAQRCRWERVHIRVAAGLSPAKQKKLTVGRLNELRYALQWLMMPIAEPRIGSSRHG